MGVSSPTFPRYGWNVASVTQNPTVYSHNVIINSIVTVLKKKSDLPGVTVGFWIYYYHDSHSEPQTAGILYMIVIPSLNLTLISIFHYITLGTPGSSKARSYADVHTVWTENCVPYIMVLTRNAKISGQEIGAAAFTNNINHFKATVVVVVWITYDMIWCDTIYLFTAIGFPPGGSDR